MEVIEENMRAIEDEIEAKLDTTISSGQNVMGGQGGRHHEHWPRSGGGLLRKDGSQSRDVVQI